MRGIDQGSARHFRLPMFLRFQYLTRNEGLSSGVLLRRS